METEKNLEITPEQYAMMSDIDKAILQHVEILDGLINHIGSIKGTSCTATPSGGIKIEGMTNEPHRIKLETQYSCIKTTINILQGVKISSTKLDPGFTHVNILQTLEFAKAQMKKDMNLDHLHIPDEIHPNDLKMIGDALVKRVREDAGKANPDASVSLRSIHDMSMSFVADVKAGNQTWTLVEKIEEL